jgi:hypothetical protein
MATDWLDRHRECINVISTIFIAGFTGTLWGATKRLWKVAGTQAKILEKSTTEARDAIKAAQTSAEAARITAEITARHERPYVFVSGETVRVYTGKLAIL